uniref:Proline-rich protein 2 n=1 Tax=Patelloida mimula TaxID=351188 RepID=A0A8U0AW73_9GAST|nr:proline-rich protein 2 [Patelloida mimula]
MKLETKLLIVVILISISSVKTYVYQRYDVSGSDPSFDMFGRAIPSDQIFRPPPRTLQSPASRVQRYTAPVRPPMRMPMRLPVAPMRSPMRTPMIQPQPMIQRRHMIHQPDNIYQAQPPHIYHGYHHPGYDPPSYDPPDLSVPDHPGRIDPGSDYFYQSTGINPGVYNPHKIASLNRAYLYT